MEDLMQNVVVLADYPELDYEWPEWKPTCGMHGNLQNPSYRLS